MSELPRIGFIGAGLMGRGMADNLLAAGHPLTIYIHKRRDGIAGLLERGARETSDFGILARASDVIFLCVDNAGTVQSVIAGLTPDLHPGHLVVDVTTSYPEITRQIAAGLRARGVEYADAPVTGGPAQAQAGTLGSLVGCEESLFPRIRELAIRYSKAVHRVGDVGTGHLAKLLNNFVSQGTVVLLAEAYTRAADFGVDWHALYSVMEAGAARSGTLEKMVKPALEGNFDGSQFTVRNALKDIGYFCRLAESSARGKSAVGEEIRRVFSSAAVAEVGDRYVSALLDPQVRNR